MGRTHDHYCKIGDFHWSPFDFDGCPEHGGYECSVYDLNHEEGQEPMFNREVDYDQT